MDLIYAEVINGQILDLGVLNNYEFDLSFGESENDFKMTAPMEGTHFHENQIIYISGTEYGGVIDAIEVDTEAQMMIYTGRTWHGILENKILYPPKGYDYMYVQGDANEVLAELLERMNIIAGEENELYNEPVYPIITAKDTLSGIYVEGRITSESGNYAHGYTFIRNLLYRFGAKPKIVDGVIEAVEYWDYSNDDDFLAETDQFRAKRSYNSLNRLHCMGQGDLRDRYVIDLYLDENGGLLPFSRENPTEDSHYYTDIDALAKAVEEHTATPEDEANFNQIIEGMITGTNEISEIYDYPNASTTYHYVPQTAQPNDWSLDLTPEKALNEKEWGFEKYFYQDEENDSKYKNVRKPDLDTRYNLQHVAPEDWMANFHDYYHKTADGWERVPSITAYDLTPSEPPHWKDYAYSNYFKLSGGNYTKVGLVQGLLLTDREPPDWGTNYAQYATANGNRVVGVPQAPVATLLTSQPEDWATNYGNYYTSDGVNYNHVSGAQKTRKKLTTSKPSNWNTNYKDYYKKVGSKYVKLTKKTTWKANTIWMDEHYTVAPKFKAKPRVYYYKLTPQPDAAPTWEANKYYANGMVVPEWQANTYYQKRNYPLWVANTYYTAEKYQPIPPWVAELYYTEYPDHYEALIEGARKKIESYMNKDSISITLDEKRVYDINDRVGASDEVTGIGAVERITQKIVKIKRGIISFDYKTGI